MPPTILGGLGAAVLALVLAGCASGDPTPKRGSLRDARGEVATPRPTQDVDSAASAIERAIGAESCRRFAPLVLTSLRPVGTTSGAPAAAKECATPGAATVRRLAGFRLVGARAYGVAALVEGTIPRTGRFTTGDLILAVDRDGRYRYAGAVPARPQLGTGPRSYARSFDEVAGRFVEAVRDGACGRAYAYTNPIGTLFGSFGGDRTRLCRALLRPGHLRRQLRADPRAMPVRQGATADLAFYGVATRTGYWTLVLARTPFRAVLRYPQHAQFTTTSVYDYYPNVEARG